MAFISTITKRSVQGDLVKVTGTYLSNGGTAGGTIKTGLKNVLTCVLQEIDTAVRANKDVVNAALPLASGDVPIVTTADKGGVWVAEGFGY